MAEMLSWYAGNFSSYAFFSWFLARLVGQIVIREGFLSSFSIFQKKGICDGSFFKMGM